MKRSITEICSDTGRNDRLTNLGFQLAALSRADNVEMPKYFFRTYKNKRIVVTNLKNAQKRTEICVEGLERESQSGRMCAWTVKFPFGKLF